STRRCIASSASGPIRSFTGCEHEPENWAPFFGKDHPPLRLARFLLPDLFSVVLAQLDPRPRGRGLFVLSTGAVAAGFALTFLLASAFRKTVPAFAGQAL